MKEIKDFHDFNKRLERAYKTCDFEQADESVMEIKHRLNALKLINDILFSDKYKVCIIEEADLETDEEKSLKTGWMHRRITNKRVIIEYKDK